jgi:signal transduction histidine kinase/ActR/RegA family two-component response regulator
MAVTDLDKGSPPVSPPATVSVPARPRRRVASIARRAIWLALAYVVATGGLLGGVLMQLRSEAIVAATRELGAFAQLTAGHTFEVAVALEEALKFTAATLAVAADSGAADEDSMRILLRDVVANARGLKDLVVLDARGRVVYQATGRGDIGVDWSDRPYFGRFEKDPPLKFEFAAPLRRDFQAAAGWSIPVAHSWRRSNGAFGGVIVGFMDPQVFDKAWTFDSEIDGLRIALISAEGTLIMRRPFAEDTLSRPLVDKDTVAQILGRPAGTLTIRDPNDGEAHLAAYRRVPDYPDLVTFIAQPTTAALAGWRRIVWIVGSGWLVASIALGALGAGLVRETRARAALQSRYHALFNSIPYPVVVSDEASRRIVAFNDAAEQQYGWEPGGDTDLPEQFSVLAARQSDFSPDAATIIPGQRHRDRNGATIDVELAVRRIAYDGKPALLTVAVDVSDRLRAEAARRTAEEQLRHSQKLDVLGQLTGGIAHDFNNILMVIIANAEVLAEKDGLDADIRKGLDRIADSAQRAEDLTRQMLAFSRKQPLRARPTNVNDLVADTGKLLRRTLGGQIEIDSILADDVWNVEIDRPQLETSLVNLCLNARDAMPSGGRVLIETQNVTIDAAREPVHGGVPPGAFVQITVSDTGRGILPADLDRIFEPFFTTKASGKGSGLGLSMVYGFIRQSNGHIAVTSDIDRGTTFRLWLPRFAGPLPEAGARPATPAVGGAERILVVEDNPQVRASVVGQLRSLGYAVSEADDGTAGIAAFEAATQPFDLLLTDVVMPGPINGKALADAVAARWPTSRIVFMSGYTDNVLGNQGGIDAAVLLLSKPFRKTDLAQMIRKALGPAGRARRG